MQTPKVTFPFVLVNFKTYPGGTGEKALQLAKIIESVSLESGVCMIPAVQLSDLRMVCEAVSVPVFAQHVDGVEYGSNTGHVLAEAVAEAGAAGTLINHSEHRVGDQVAACVAAANRVGLTTVVCAQDSDEAQTLGELDVDYIAVEPPELIGGDISVSTANPDLISDSVAKVGEGRVVVGAGVKTGEDVKIAKELGSVGILVASGVCKVDNPEEVLMDFASNFR